MGNCTSSAVVNKEGPILDRYECLDEVKEELRKRGLESSDLMIFIDYTKSNEWAGTTTFGGKSLHDLKDGHNPYQQVVSIIGSTLASFDDDKLIPTFGFGDVQTRGSSLFSFQRDEVPVHTFERILSLYGQITPNINLSGPTSFAPAINKAIDIVIRAGHAYHIMIIIADGQVSEHCMADTVTAIVRASHYCLSIIMVGVGDGPWDDMENFDDGLPARQFDNFQFVNFSSIMVKCMRGGFTKEKADAAFALNALMEIPDQYRIIKEKKLLGQQEMSVLLEPPRIKVHDPPVTGNMSGISYGSDSMNRQLSAPQYDIRQIVTGYQV